MKKLGIQFLFTALLFFAFIHAAYAVDCSNNNTGSGSNYNYQSATSNCPPTLDQVTSIIIAVIDIILVLAVIIFFFMLVINGFNFITSFANPEKIEAARKGVLFTIVGFGLVFGAFIILNIIRFATGVSAGFSVGTNGNIQFNILSTFTPTNPSVTAPK